MPSSAEIYAPPEEELPELDIGVVRAQFPAFSAPATARGAFFENAGGSYPCRQTLEHLTAFYTDCKVQPHGPFPPSREAARRMEEATQRLSALLNLPAGHELIPGPSTSQHAYVLATAFAGLLKPGDEIIVTDQDHEANSGFWRRLAGMGVVVREWRLNPETGMLDPDDLESLLSRRTRFVAFPHCSNIVGYINEAAAIVRRVHAAGALAIVDGVSAAPHGLPDLAAIDADVYFFSAYKTWGPHQGLMAIRRSLLFELPTQGHFFNENDPAKRLLPAGPDHAQVAALAGIADYVSTLHAAHGGDSGMPPAARNRRIARMMRRRELALLSPLMEFLVHAERKGRLRLLGPGHSSRRAPTLSLETKRPPAEVARSLAEHDVWAGAGDFYAVRTLQALGVGPQRGVLRLSFLHYTTEEEITRLMDALDAAL
jgi:selenocysteine lyase/cysteine desulfurase